MPKGLNTLITDIYYEYEGIEVLKKLIISGHL